MYSPIPDPKEIEQDAERIWPEKVPAEIAGVRMNGGVQLRLLHDMEAIYSEAPWHDMRTDELRYSYHDGGWNVWYTKVDALVAYAMLRLHHTRHLIEIGSGYSSALILDINDRFLEGRMKCTFIDPDTERLRILLRDRDWKEQVIIPHRVQAVPLEHFDSLDVNDVLFIDSSHQAKCGSDVNHLFFEVLPRLKAGVYIHFHDIFDDFEYPREWLEKGIHFSEAYLLRAFLMHNHDYEVVFWGAFMGRGSSLWLQKVHA